jgi:endonuclease G, mitochondrial
VFDVESASLAPQLRARSTGGGWEATMVLDVDDIPEIHKMAVLAGLHNKRDLLLYGVNIEYVANLPILGNLSDQLLSDLQTMNADGEVIGGVPLVRWLKNAADALSVRPDRQKFFRDFQIKAARSVDATKQPQQPDPMKQERILFDSDLLPFGFLAGAARTGRSVGRLSVPRFEGGQQTMKATSQDSVLFFGTGWLIGKKHVVTNHHVINARTEGEAPASAEDFEFQARSTFVQFDYNEENVPGDKFNIVALSAKNAQLDYAVLELDREPGPERPPLPIWAKPIDFTGGTRLPVNIIQHPGGQPKQIAIRNNLAAAMKGDDLAYFTDTAAGSSGSPVCNDRWYVLALHKASSISFGKYNYQGKDTAWVNVGTTMERIVADLQANSPALWANLGAVMV